jgi:hypothetical protein
LEAWCGMPHGKLLTNENKARRSLSSEAHCHLCPTFVESIVPVLRDCPTSKEELETVYTITTPTWVLPYRREFLGFEKFVQPCSHQRRMELAYGVWGHSLAYMESKEPENFQGASWISI